MLKPITDGVWTHESQFLQSQAVVVEGATGVLLIDPGITGDELTCLADDLHKLGRSVTIGFSTHPHWDHLLWHDQLGDAPRYGTARNVADVQDFLAHPDWKTLILPLLPPDLAPEIPLDLLGNIAGLPAGTVQLSWDGPRVQIIEHQAHAAGHAALLIEPSGVLVVGDMLSDILIPMLDLESADPINDYLAALQLFEDAAHKVNVFIPGHGSVGTGDQFRARIAQDRTYVQALRDGTASDDPRIGPAAKHEWVPGIHQHQLQGLASKAAPE